MNNRTGGTGIVEEGRVRLVRSKEHNKNATGCQARPSRRLISAAASLDVQGDSPLGVRLGHRPTPTPALRVAGPVLVPRATSRGAAVSPPARHLAAIRSICSPSRAPYLTVLQNAGSGVQRFATAPFRRCTIRPFLAGLHSGRPLPAFRARRAADGGHASMRVRRVLSFPLSESFS
jgi:hypothetical protein